LLHDMEDEKMKDIKKQLVNIATSGGASKINIYALGSITEYLDGLAEDISALKLLFTKAKATGGMA